MADIIDTDGDIIEAGGGRGVFVRSESRSRCFHRLVMERNEAGQDGWVCGCERGETLGVQRDMSKRLSCQHFRRYMGYIVRAEAARKRRTPPVGARTISALMD